MFKHSSPSRLKNITRKINNLERTKKTDGVKVPLLMEKIEAGDTLFHRKMQSLTEEMAKIEKNLKEERDLIGSANREVEEALEEFQGSLQLKQIDIDFEFNLESLKLPAFDTTKIEDTKSNLELLRDDLDKEEEHRNQLYSRLVSDIGQQVQEAQQLIRARRQKRLKSSSDIRHSLTELHKYFELQLRQETQLRTRQEEQFARLLQQTCIKIENQLI